MQATETVSQGRSGGTSCVPRCPLRPHLQNTNSDRITKNFRTATTERGPLRAGRRVTARESGPRGQLRCRTPPPPRDTCLTGRLAIPHTVLSHPRPDGRYDHIRDASEKLVLSLLCERAPPLVLKLRSSREPGLPERVWAPDARRPGLLRLPPEGMQDPNAAATPSPGKRGPRTPTTSDPARACLQRPRRAVKAEMCEQESPLKIPSRRGGHFERSWRCSQFTGRNQCQRNSIGGKTMISSDPFCSCFRVSGTS